MLEIITGIVLAIAAGLNAYIPLLGLGLLARFTDFVALPDAWGWLAEGWVMVVLAVLLVVEMIVDKVPALDTVNDVLQTVIRPASGGLAFSAGAGSATVAVRAPSDLAQPEHVWPIVVGVVIALVPHLLKALSRPLLNFLTGGLGAPILSFFEDLGAASLTVLAVLVPVVALLAAIAAVILLVWRMRRGWRARRTSSAAASSPQNPT